MTRASYAFATPDVSAFARALGRSLKERHATKPQPPGHVELLNLIAKAAGFRNTQAMRATIPAPALLPTDLLPTPAATDAAPAKLSDNARKTLNQFDDSGRLIRWPVKYSVQTLAMWTMWTRFEAKRSYTEKEVNAILKTANTFGDHATLRRELINHKLMSRQSDCTDYRKLPARPDEETRTLLAAWRAKSRS